MKITARNRERRTVIVADGTPDEVFKRSEPRFAQLGIWVPERYMRDEYRIKPIHVDGEPDYPAREGAGEPVLYTHDLAIGRNGTAVATGIDLAFKQGQITAVVGANGAGKSTLAHPRRSARTGKRRRGSIALAGGRRSRHTP